MTLNRRGFLLGLFAPALLPRAGVITIHVNGDASDVARKIAGLLQKQTQMRNTVRWKDEPRVRVTQVEVIDATHPMWPFTVEAQTLRRCE